MSWGGGKVGPLKDMYYSGFTRSRNQRRRDGVPRVAKTNAPALQVYTHTVGPERRRQPRPAELWEQLLSSKQMSLSELKRSRHSRVKSQSIPRRGTPFQGPLAGIYGWGPAPILL